VGGQVRRGGRGGFVGWVGSIPPPGGDAGALGRRLYYEHRIEVPVFPWPSPPRRMVRLSAQLYNDEGHMRALAAGLLRSMDGDSGAGGASGAGGPSGGASQIPERRPQAP